jgi:hypothetical protein
MNPVAHVVPSENEEWGALISSHSCDRMQDTHDATIMHATYLVQSQLAVEFLQFLKAIIN